MVCVPVEEPVVREIILFLNVTETSSVITKTTASLIFHLHS